MLRNALSPKYDSTRVEACSAHLITVKANEVQTGPECVRWSINSVTAPKDGKAIIANHFANEKHARQINALRCGCLSHAGLLPSWLASVEPHASKRGRTGVCVRMALRSMLRGSVLAEWSQFAFASGGALVAAERVLPQAGTN